MVYYCINTMLNGRNTSPGSHLLNKIESCSTYKWIIGNLVTQDNVHKCTKYRVLSYVISTIWITECWTGKDMHRYFGLLPGTTLTSSWNNEKKHNKSKSQEEISRLRCEPAASQYETKCKRLSHIIHMQNNRKAKQVCSVHTDMLLLVTGTIIIMK